MRVTYTRLVHVAVVRAIDVGGQARQPEARQPKARQPEARQPKARQPEARQPEARQPEARTNVQTLEKKMFSIL